MTATKKFRTKLPQLFHVANLDSMIRDIWQQFSEGYARSVSPDVYEVDIHDIPARVVMRDRCLMAVWYVPMGG